MMGVPEHVELFPLVVAIIALGGSTLFTLWVAFDILSPLSRDTRTARNSANDGDTKDHFSCDDSDDSDEFEFDLDEEEDPEQPREQRKEPAVFKKSETSADGVAAALDYFTESAVDVDSYFPEEHEVIHSKIGVLSSSNIYNNEKAHKKGSVLMSWRKVSCSYPAKNGDQEDNVTLHNAHGELISGELTAIMGASGGGKSTLMNILSGRKAVGNITGEMSINQVCLRDMQKAGDLLRNTVAYVPQDEAFFPMQTPEEAVEFVANLKHGKNGFKRSEVHRILREVGLGDPDLYHRPIGGALAGGLQITGLSGGERKRLALACALILKPQLIMLDEITSGLDSDNALTTIERVKEVCLNHNVAAVVVIHQPNGFIFQAFDRLILLAKGKTIFSDNISNLGRLYKHRFKQNMPTSSHELPLDLLAKLKNPIGEESDEIEERPLAPSVAGMEPPRRKVTEFWKLRVVFKRNLLNHYLRNYTNLAARLLCYAACSLLDGAIFWQIGVPQNPTVIGALTFILLISYLLPFATIPVFVNDKKFFLSERSLGLYSPWIYCVSQTLLEMWVLIIAATLQSIIVIPMAKLWNAEVDNWITFFTLFSGLVASGLTGSTLVLFFSILLPSQDLTFICGAGIVCMSLGVSGGFVPFTQIADFISWLQWISPCKYSLQALALAYYKEDEGEMFMETTQLNRPDSVSANIGVLFLMFGTLALSTMYVLSHKREVR